MDNKKQEEFKALEKDNNKILTLIDNYLNTFKKNPDKYDKRINTQEKDKKFHEIKAELLKPNTNQEQINQLAKSYREYKEKEKASMPDYTPDKEAEEKLNKDYDEWSRKEEDKFEQLKKKAIEEDNARKFLEAKSDGMKIRRRREQKIYEQELEKESPNINIMKSVIHNNERYAEQWKEMDSYYGMVESEYADNYFGPSKASELYKSILDD